MTRFIAAVAALVVLLAAIVLLAPGLVPAKAYKGRLEAEASKALGRAVTLGDELSFKIIPQTAFVVSDLVIANAEGFEGDYLARVERADIGVRLMPLFSGNVEISRFVLTRPDLSLQKAKSGAVNWNLASSSAPQAEGAPGQTPRDVSLGDVRLVDGRAVYADAAAGKTYTLDAINADVRLASLAEPLEIDGAMNFQGAPATAKVVLTNLADMLAKKETNLKLDLRLGDATVGADLALAGGDTLSYAGPISVNAPDLPALAKLFDVALADAPGFDRLSLSGEANGAPTSLALSAAKIGFDAIDATGDLKLDWAGAKPKATGALSMGALDLRPYMPPPVEGAQGFPAWSADKMDFTSLRNIDADLDLTAGKVFLNDIETGAARMRLKIANARMTADIPQIGFYQGGGSGKLVVDAAKATPSIAGDFKMSSVQANPFTIDLMKIDRVLGLGGFTLTFNATGSSQKAIMESLDGKGGFDLADGALKGINIAKIAATVTKLYEGGLTNPAAITSAIAEARRPDERTDFSKFLTTFSIVDGQMQAPNIQLEGPYLTMTGVGKVNLPGQAVDIRLLPRASTSADGKEGRKIAIPIKIGGTFSQPTVGVDVEALVRGRAEQTVKGLLDNALGGKSDTSDPGKALLDGILGRPKADPKATDSATTAPATDAKPATAEDTTRAIAGEALKGLFGRKSKQPAEETETADEPN
ncbi:MAG: AsmA family protein [Parvularculaceae bacterium]|nr:AsmA family protein [Parvularculaceae bacterium]